MITIMIGVYLAAAMFTTLVMVASFRQSALATIGLSVFYIGASVQAPTGCPAEGKTSVSRPRGSAPCERPATCRQGRGARPPPKGRQVRLGNE